MPTSLTIPVELLAHSPLWLLAEVTHSTALAPKPKSDSHHLVTLSSTIDQCYGV
jgi:hypothetical protein